MTRTRLPDGRIVCIGGEHEAYHDLDFFIYNDVVVIEPDGFVQIFGYSIEEFAPTDFHSATLVGDRIYVIGGLGYQGLRGNGATPVYSLDVESMHMVRVTPSEPSPGWIFKHRAELAGDGKSIRVAGGEIITFDAEGKEITSENDRVFSFDTTRNIWSRAEGAVPTNVWKLGDVALDTWESIASGKEAQKLQAEIMLAVGPRRPLFCEDYWPVARKREWPHRIMVRMLDGSGRLGICDMPEGCGREEPPLPVTFYRDLGELIDSQGQKGGE